MNTTNALFLEGKGVYEAAPFILNHFSSPDFDREGCGAIRLPFKIEYTHPPSALFQAARAWANKFHANATLDDRWEVLVYLFDGSQEVLCGALRFRSHPEGGWSHDGIYVHPL